MARLLRLLHRPRCAADQPAVPAQSPVVIADDGAPAEEGPEDVITSPAKVAIAVENAFANHARQWHDWAEKISLLSRPTAALEIARFLLSL